MKYILTKEVVTGRGFKYTHYLKSFSDGSPTMVLSTMSIEEAKTYTSRKAAREDQKKLGGSWTIEKQ